jgi:hypothetical protein
MVDYAKPIEICLLQYNSNGAQALPTAEPMWIPAKVLNVSDDGIAVDVRFTRPGTETVSTMTVHRDKVRNTA